MSESVGFGVIIKHADDTQRVAAALVEQTGEPRGYGTVRRIVDSANAGKARPRACSPFLPSRNCRFLYPSNFIRLHVSHKVIVTEDLAPSPLQWLRERCDVVHAPVGSQAFDDELAHAHGLIVRTYTRVDDALLARAPRLACVGRAGVGLDTIDLGACAARGVRVVHTPDANTNAVSELVLCLVMDSLRPRVFLDRALTLSEWKSLRKELTAPRELRGRTMGILGFGRIGSSVARWAGALGMLVQYCDIRDIAPELRSGAAPVGVHELFATSDIVSLHIDPRESNRRFVAQDLLERMPRHSILINTSRGMVVDEAALADVLKRRTDLTAMLDVHEPEPFGPAYPLLGIRNAHLLPHIAACTARAQEAMSWVVKDVLDVLAGTRPDA